jgi:hypothetical protein
MTNETTIPRRSIVSHCPGRRRFRLRIAGILEAKRLRTLAVLTTLLLGACRATVPAAPAEVENVGALAPSYHSIATAPVHATTDLSGGFQAVDSDETPAVADGGSADGDVAPDVVSKDGGLRAGAAR